jgi:hypothetical protein
VGEVEGGRGEDGNWAHNETTPNEGGIVNGQYAVFLLGSSSLVDHNGQLTCFYLLFDFIILLLNARISHR